MRIGIISPPGREKMRWTARGFREAGHAVDLIGSVDELRSIDGLADIVVFGHKGAGLGTPDILDAARRREAVWVQWITDLMAVEPGKPLAEQCTIHEQSLAEMRAMDIVFAKERGLLGEYRELGINARWLDQACPSHLPACTHPRKPEWDVLFWGNCDSSYRQRQEDMAMLASAGYVVAWVVQPGGERVPPGCLPLPYAQPENLPALASRARVTLGVDLRHDLDGYWSDRLWLALGMGSCHLRRRSPGLPRTGRFGGPYPLFGKARHETGNDPAEESPADRLKRLTYRNRRDYGEEARRWVLANHTYRQRAEQLLKEVHQWHRNRTKPAGPVTAQAR